MSTTDVEAVAQLNEARDKIYDEVGEMITADITDPLSLGKEIKKLLNSNIETRKNIIETQFNSIKKHNWNLIVQRLEHILNF